MSTAASYRLPPIHCSIPSCAAVAHPLCPQVWFDMPFPFTATLPRGQAPRRRVSDRCAPRLRRRPLRYRAIRPPIEKGPGRVGPAEHGREYGPVVFDPLQHCATVLHPQARAFHAVGAAGVRAGVCRLGPHRALGVQADAVGTHSVAQIRRPERLPSAAMSNAVSLPAKDSEMIRVALSGVMTMPFGNSMSVATHRAVPSGATSAMSSGVGGSPPRKSKPKPFT